MKLIQNKVLIERLSPKEGIIIIPDTAKKRSLLGRVLEVGTGRVLRSGEKLKITVKPGEVVIYPDHFGTEVEYESKTLLVIRETDILAILDEIPKKWEISREFKL